MKKGYQEKDVDGMLIKEQNGKNSLYPCPVTVRLTCDGIGQTLSLNAGNTMILVPLEGLTGIIKASAFEAAELSKTFKEKQKNNEYCDNYLETGVTQCV